MFLNTGSARRLKLPDELKDGPLDALVHYDSKLDVFDRRREIFIRQHSQSPPDVLRDVLAAVEYVSLYEFWRKFAFCRGRFVAVTNTSVLMVTPSYGAHCANVQHSAHAGYAKACVIAYWRLMPTEDRHKVYMNQNVQSGNAKKICVHTLGGTEFVAPLVVSGGEDMTRFLGVSDLYAKFEGRAYGRRYVDGWALALLEMLVDPVLLAWVPKWVREQYERANPYFRRVLETMSGEECHSNRSFLLRLCERMVVRHKRAALRKVRDGKQAVESDFVSSDGAGEDPGGESEVEADEVTAERDSAGGGIEEGLSDAGAAPVTNDSSTRADQAGQSSKKGRTMNWQ